MPTRKLAKCWSPLIDSNWILTPLWFCGETMDGIWAITESGPSTPTMSRPIESRSFSGFLESRKPTVPLINLPKPSISSLRWLSWPGFQDLQGTSRSMVSACYRFSRIRPLGCAIMPIIAILEASGWGVRFAQKGIGWWNGKCLENPMPPRSMSCMTICRIQGRPVIWQRCVPLPWHR